MAAAGPDAGTAKVVAGPLKLNSDLQDLSGSARWVLSGAKPGHGIDQLLDGDVSAELRQVAARPLTKALVHADGNVLAV